MYRNLIMTIVALVVILGGVFSVAQDGLDRDYASAAQRIIAAAQSDTGVWSKLETLCDRIGHRLSGSPQLDEAIRWAAEEMRRDGLENVQIQPVKVPRWVRGEESGEILAPVRRPLHMLGLGGSVGTTEGGLTAPVVVVNSFDELEELGRDKVEGKIVVYNPEWQGYGRTVRYRADGASQAARFGAVAALVRSMTPVSLQSPHTGGMNYDEAYPKIPTAAISLEDAALLQRLSRGSEPVEVTLRMEAQTWPDADSGNVIGEIRGNEKPEEIVVIGGHIDSWDVGQGAHDDGGGVVVSMQAAALLKNLGLRPRRTLRVVLFTNEENGLAGGRAYYDSVQAEVGNHVAAIEMDGGAEEPVGFGLGVRGSGPPAASALALVRQIGRLLEPIGADHITAGGGGADIGPLMRAGVPGLGLRTVGVHYFDWHHTHSDTLDKVNPEELKANLAAMAVMAFVLADMPDRLPHGAP